MDIEITEVPIAITKVAELASKQFGNLVKATVDVQKGIVAIGGELHADEEQLMLENGSKQHDLWGINLYPEKFGTEEFVEFDSMINLRPSQGNLSRGVEDEKIREQIYNVIGSIVISERELKDAA